MDPGVIATIIAAVIGAAGSIAAAVITVRAYRRSTSVDSDSVRTSQQERGEPPATSRTSERASTEERRDLPRPEVENRETKGPPSRTHQIRGLRTRRPPRANRKGRRAKETAGGVVRTEGSVAAAGENPRFPDGATGASATDAGHDDRRLGGLYP
jgi:hypothetical protein